MEKEVLKVWNTAVVIACAVFRSDLDSTCTAVCCNSVGHVAPRTR